MPIDKLKAIEFANDVENHGFNKALEIWDIRPSSGERYLRRAKEKPKAPPKILLFDIETLPMEVFVWGLYKQRIPPDNIIREWCVLSWAAKWLNEDKYYSEILTPTQAKKHDDKAILKGVWQLLEEADIVISHNGKRFDHRKLNARFIYHKMNPTTPYQVIDTLQQSRNIAAFSSHKLNYLGQFLVSKAKLETDFELWVKCRNGDAQSLEYMLKYNEQDVGLLEEVYYELRPWMKNHPNWGVYVEGYKNACPTCGSENLEWGGSYVTAVGKYSTFRCECGAIGRSRQTELSKEVRKELTMSVAR